MGKRKTQRGGKHGLTPQGSIKIKIENQDDAVAFMRELRNTFGPVEWMKVSSEMLFELVVDDEPSMQKAEAIMEKMETELSYQNTGVYLAMAATLLANVGMAIEARQNESPKDLLN
jgi:hypothetical protein